MERKQACACVATGSIAAFMGIVLMASGPNSDRNETEPSSIVHLDQGWSDELRQLYYHTSQGTAMLPYHLYANLEEADSERLIASVEFSEKHGLFEGKQDARHNPDGLPVGMARRTINEGLFEGEWIGFTCSACHSGQLHYKGQRIRIDGGSNSVFSMPNYADAIREAMDATLKDEDKLDRLMTRAKDSVDLSRGEMRTELERISKHLAYYADKITQSPYDFGPGRMDALTQIHNTIVGAYLDIPENVEMTMAPTKAPFVWNTPQSAWVQWSGVFDVPLYRNLGESIGAGVRVNLDGEQGELFESTVDLENQLALEDWIRDLAPPKWPEDIFGKIDHKLAAKGKELVTTNCYSCHSVYPHRWSNPRLKGKRFIENALVPQEYVGTDAQQFRSAPLDPLQLYLAGGTSEYLLEPNTGDIAASSGGIQDVMKYGVVEKYLDELDLTEDEYLQMYNYTDGSEPAPPGPSYKAAPLDGMWAVPPYLHNGSVPSVYDLLLPASQRPKKFFHGRDFDPKKLGLDTTGKSGRFEVDTSLIGSSNLGHSFEDGTLGNGVVGRAFTDDERWAIIEYMKTLPGEDAQVTPYGGPENPVGAWEDESFFNNQYEGWYDASGAYKNEKPRKDKYSVGLGEETIEPNEEALIRAIGLITEERLRRSYDDDEIVQRDAHAKTHGLVRATFTVEEGLPDELRHGVFATPRSFDAVIRFSASSQIAQPDTSAQPHGMAIKLFGVEGKKIIESMGDSTTQDFVMINFPIFFAGDLATYIEAEQLVSAASAESPAEVQKMIEQFASAHPETFAIVERMAANPFYNPLQVSYWSQTPYRLGPNAIKFSVKPASGNQSKEPDGELGPDFLRQTMIDTIREDVVRFEFFVQVQRDASKQPIEDPTIEWLESDTKPQRVAIIEIPAQDISGNTNLQVAEQLSFAAWNCLPEHRPLGSMNRARRVVYEHGSVLRHKENEMKRQEPTQVPNW